MGARRLFTTTKLLIKKEQLKKMHYGDVMRNKMLTTNAKIINKVLRKLPMIFPHRQDYLLFNPTIIHEWNKIIEQITQDI